MLFLLQEVFFCLDLQVATDIPYERNIRPDIKNTLLPIEINSTMIAPLNIGINFTHLIQKIKQKKKNITLELIF